MSTVDMSSVRLIEQMEKEGELIFKNEKERFNFVNAIASQGIEGAVFSREELLMAKKVDDGEISFEEYVELILKDNKEKSKSRE